MDKALSYLGIMRKAGACAVTEIDCGSLCREGKAKLLLLASDASENARSRANGFVYGRKIPLVTVPYTKMELSGRLGRGAISMIAVEDLGLAVAFMKALGAGNDTYNDVIKQLEEKLTLANKRKSEKQAHERNKKLGKRRTKA